MRKLKFRKEQKLSKFIQLVSGRSEFCIMIIVWEKWNNWLCKAFYVWTNLDIISTADFIHSISDDRAKVI